MTKLVFFDVDGVLSVPRYDIEGRMTIGTTSEKWIAYCRVHGEDTYEYCTGIGPVRAYAEKRKREGARLFVLSAVACEEEARAKDRFIERLYPGLFEACYYVNEAAAKIPFIVKKAEEEGVPVSSCELVEDNLDVLFTANTEGITPMHLSMLIDEGVIDPAGTRNMDQAEAK
ncbi:MAG: hypothetical protein J6Y95_07735 [Lachnospiraceae bacterium]|nr:hypothetical protein [Lachnospiraceae bacterium]